MSACLSQLLALLVITPFALSNKTFSSIFKLRVMKYVLLSCILTGVIFYSLVFIAVKHLDPVTISILLLFELPATYIVLVLFGKEKVRMIQLVGSILVLIASVMVVYKEGLAIHSMSILVIIAVFFAPMGNYYNKVSREYVSATVFLCVRGVLSALFIFVLAIFFEGLPTKGDIYSSLYFIIPNGILVFGLSKILWVEGIYRISIGKAISLNSTFPLVTMLGSYLLLGIVPTNIQYYALVPGFLGVYLLTRNNSG